MPRFLHAHPSDRLTAHEAAEKFGKMLAQGLLSYDEIMRALAPHSSPEQARLAWTLLDNAALWELRRANTEREIFFAIKPLIDKLADAAPILTAAHAVNHRFGAGLLAHEVVACVETSMSYKLASLRRMRNRG